MAMAAAKTEPLPISRRVDVAEQGNGLAGDDDRVDVESAVEPSSFRDLRKRVSRLSVEGAAAAGLKVDNRRGGGVGNGKVSLPPPHAWLAVEDNNNRNTEEKWTRVLQGGGVGVVGGGDVAAARNQHRQMQRRSSFSVVKRERAAREAWLDRAWEMKKSWHQRNGGAPDADTPVVVVVGKGGGGGAPMSPLSSSNGAAAGAVGGGGVAMDMEEVRACRELGLELPSDCTVEIQCYGLSAASSPTHHAAGGGGGGSCCSSGAASPSAACCSSPAADDPVDVKARLKVWAQAVALASTTHLGS